MLKINNLSFSFDKQKTLLDDVNLTLEPNSLYCLIGANGCGKTTFFRILQGDLKPQSGEIDKGTSGDTLYLPVQYQVAPFLTEKQLYGLIEKTNNHKMMIKPSDHIAENKILGDYSTGMLQQVMLNLIANAEQELILIDEPLATLDMVNKEVCIQRLQNLAKSGKIIIISTQEPDVAYQLNEKLLILESKTIQHYQLESDAYESFKATIISKLLIGRT